MLARQGWRLIKNPDTLAAKVLHGYYFSSSNFLATDLTSKASFKWQSLYWGRELLRKWIRPTDFMVYSPKVHEDVKLVCHLKTVSRVWDGNLIRGLFIASDAEAILSIPVSSSQREVPSVGINREMVIIR
ncbi:hypothetical protein EZV62_000813 [Acer yangbiense]|uniref:Reverse transcriptase zinc-binding domain-containing protein n=1 Tax=Acer yangbiense TaxID=1000413 RepID=A0A5C7ITT9_9ROSI|nr:hypothetical protein EZV62_028073 [Acer yangbiense]TXG72234.1 hypothetical protein EZV62_000813 [Acer yangbiense]